MSSSHDVVAMRDGAELWTASEYRPGRDGMVFLHGGPGMWDYLEPVADLVADLVNVHRYDQRGCGRSSPSRDYSIARYVADVEELREHWGYDRWFVFGHSFGASLGLTYAAAHPDRVTGLVYCDGVGLDWPRFRGIYHERAAARLTAAELDRRDELAVRDRTWGEEVEWRALCWQPDFMDPAAAQEDAQTPLQLNLECNRALGPSGADQSAECARVRAPVLVVHGEADPRPIDGVRLLVDALSAAHLVTIPDAGHQPWREQPAQLRTLLRDFLLYGVSRT